LLEGHCLAEFFC